MIFSIATRSFADLFAPAIRSVLWKVIGLTLVVLVAFWLLIRSLFVAWIGPYFEPYLSGMGEWAGWLTFIVGLFAAFGLAAGLGMLLAPVSAIIAGLFLDDVADVVEGTDYPADPPGQALPLMTSILASLRFFLVVVLANIVALLFLLVPGVNLVIFFVVNGYLIGREYFEFAASRFRGVKGARAFRSERQGTVMLAGLVIALFLFVPILNILTPLYAAIFMVHLNKALSKASPVSHASATPIR